MNNNLLITAESGNKYLYADAAKYSFYVPGGFAEVIAGKSNDGESYYRKKLHFFHEHGLLNHEEIKLTSHYSGDQVRKNLANLRQLLIEVTDGCNLKCKYCGSSSSFSNFNSNKKDGKYSPEGGGFNYDW